MTQPRRKMRIGHVVSDKAEKTVIVAVEWRSRHPLYRKSIRRITRFSVHDEHNQCRLGDQVRIVETRPLSKTKRWRVLETLTRREVPEIQPREIGAPPEQAIEATTATRIEETLEEVPATVAPAVEEVAEPAEEPEAPVATAEVPEPAEEAEAPTATAEAPEPTEEPEARPKGEEETT